MDVFTKDDLKSLLDHEPGWCVSLYLPTHRTGPETEQNPIRFKNLVQKAQDLLMEKGMRRSEASAYLAEASALLPNDDFWRNQSDGLAVFVSPAGTQAYRMPVRFEDLVTVSGSCHLKPLVPFLTGDGRFYILALSQKSLRVLAGSRDSVAEVEVEGLPGSMAEAPGYENIERQLQWHTQTSQRRGERAAVFHGQAVEDDAKSRIRHYFQIVDRGMQELLAGQNIPLVLAGVEYLLPIYAEANSYPHLLAEGVTGNPEELSAQELHRRAWALVEPDFDKAREEALAKYQAMIGTGLASADPRQVIAGAYYGKVESLFFAINCHVWGRFDPDSGEVELLESGEGEGVEDLSDFAVVRTILNQGSAYPVAQEGMPEQCTLAAVFRY